MEKKKCEFCGEEIHINSRRCPFCAGIQKEQSVEENNLVPPIEVQPDSEINVSSQPVSDTMYEKLEEKNEVIREPMNRNTAPNVNTHNSNQIEPPISNALKVFLSVISSIIPGVGQIIGIISAIVFMSSDNDEDRKSFGKSLLTASLVVFILWGLCCILIFAAAIGNQIINNNR